MVVLHKRRSELLQHIISISEIEEKYPVYWFEVEECPSG